MTDYTQAECIDAPHEWFFPEGNPAAGVDYKPALALCAECPIKDGCLDDHLQELWGVFGGTTPKVRKQVRKDRGGRISVTKKVEKMLARKQRWWTVAELAESVDAGVVTVRSGLANLVERGHIETDTSARENRYRHR